MTATALAIEVREDKDVAEQAMFLSCDLPGEDWKTDLFRELEGRCPDLDRRNITVNCTHTHNAPPVRRGMYGEPENDPGFMNPDEYRMWLVAILADVIEKAWKTRRHGSISRGFGYAVVGRCRRALYRDGTARMYGNTDSVDFQGFESCDDHAVNMLFTRNIAGELTGILVNLACPSQCLESLEALAADFWHDVRSAVADRYGANVHLLPQCAPAGDMSPHLLADQTEEKDLRDRIGVDDCRIIARRIMAAIDEALATASPSEDTVIFSHQVYNWHVPRLLVTEEEYALEKRIPELSEEERASQHYAFQRIWPFGPVCDLVSRYEQQTKNPEHEVESHIIRLGDVVFATNPFELFVEYGMQIRCRSRALQTFLVQLADGSGKGFYLPTQRALAGGHYSAQVKSNWVGPEGGLLLVERTVAAINTLFADSEYARTR